jgi:hypothetical protein
MTILLHVTSQSTDYRYNFCFDYVIFDHTWFDLPGKSRRQENRQKPISVASQEKKSQIATLATDSAIPGPTPPAEVSA